MLCVAGSLRTIVTHILQVPKCRDTSLGTVTEYNTLSYVKMYIRVFSRLEYVTNSRILKGMSNNELANRLS